MDTEHQELLAKVAGMYFEDGLNQAEIARKTGYSRSMISRLLTEARSQGIVEIRIHHPIDRRSDLEAALRAMLGLKTTRVLAGGGLAYPQMLRRLGALAARLIEDLITDKITIGVSWGTAVWETVNALRPGIRSGLNVVQLSGVVVVQMIGALGTPNPEIDGPELARRMASILVGSYTTLPVPLFVRDEDTRASLLRDPNVRRVVDQFKTVDLALVGVGAVDPQTSSLLRAGYLNAGQLSELCDAGAVGDVCAIHFGIDGRLIDTPLTRREVGIDADTLRAISNKVGVAGGRSKIQAIIGAARAGLINILVTDETTAVGILQEMGVISHSEQFSIEQEMKS